MMNETPSARTFAKLKALLKVEEAHRRYGSLEEAAAAANLIQELIARYKIEATEVDKLREEEDNPLTQELVYPSMYGAEIKEERVRWTEELGEAVAFACYCTLLNYGSNNLLTFTGRAVDVNAAKGMFIRLARTAIGLMREDRERAKRLDPPSLMVGGGAYFPPAVDDKLYEDSYYTGYVRGLAERIAQTRSRLEIEAGMSQALVRAGQEVVKYAEEITGANYSESLPVPEVDYQALLDGMLRGKTVRIEGAELTAPKETKDHE